VSVKVSYVVPATLRLRWYPRGRCGVQPHRRAAQAIRGFVYDPDAARAAGQAGRRVALRFSLDRFLADWDNVLDATVVR
jgi:hypothetical protein